MTALRLVENTGTAQRASSSPSQARPAQLYAPSREGERDRYLSAALEAFFVDYQSSMENWQNYRSSSDQVFAHSVQSIVEEVGRLGDGWLGPGSVAPRASVTLDVQFLAASLPLATRTPQVELDPSDGEVKLAWRSADEPRSLAISMMGDGKARIIQSNLGVSVKLPVIEIMLSASMLRDGARVLQLLEHSDLFVDK